MAARNNYADVPRSHRADWTDTTINCTPQVPGTRQSTCVHWVGTTAPMIKTAQNLGHKYCLDWMRANEAQDTAPDKGYCAIQYNYAVCGHGYLITGRGKLRQSAANGDVLPNMESGSVVVLMGESETPTDAMLHAVRAAGEALAPNHPASFVPHSHYVATQCPGNVLRAWIVKGCPDPFNRWYRRIARWSKRIRVLKRRRQRAHRKVS